MKLQTKAFRRGFATVFPLWLAAAPFGLAYVIAAQGANLSNLEIQLMSLTVFAAAAQLALVQLISTESSIWIMLVTVLVMNLHHLLYGLSLGRRFNFSQQQRLLASFLLTDAAYGVTIAEDKQEHIWFLFGAELSMYVAWNLFTGLGIWLGSVIARPPAAQLNFVVPLTFFLLLVSVVKTRLELLVAIASLGLALGLNRIGVGSTAVLLVAIIGSLLGMGMHNLQEQNK